jgi:LL-diaminopimelate aminotransferase
MAVGNAAVLASLAKLKGNIDSGIFRPVQEAAVRALSVPHEWISERNRIYRERIDILSRALESVGMQHSIPQATLYIWATLPDSTARSKDQTSEAFALKLLNETGVALAPGSFFGAAGEGYVRVSVTASTEQIRKAADRIGNFKQM